MNTETSQDIAERLGCIGVLLTFAVLVILSAQLWQ